MARSRRTVRIVRPSALARLAPLALLIACSPALAQSEPDDFLLRGSNEIPPATDGIPWYDDEEAAAPTPPAERVEAEPEPIRRNPRALPVNRRKGGPVTEPREDQRGIRIGRFLMRPALTERIVTETTDEDERVFSETQLAVDILSDWSRHELLIEGRADFEENLSGDAPTDPSASLDAALRLDLSGATTAELRAGYEFFREDESDPNALAGAATQAGIHRFTAAAGIERDAGLFRGSLDLEGEREIFGEAELGDGTALDLGDRDQTTLRLVSRAAYDRSAILAPFIESELERTEFDRTRDRFGYERSAWTYGLRGGLEIDLGEKWSGELAAGYALRDIDDTRLASIGTVTLDGLVNWSPRRGTDVALGFLTDIESSTTPGLPGSVAYRSYATVSQQLRGGVIARLGGGMTIRDFRGLAIADQHVYDVTTELAWPLGPHLEIVADAGYERTVQEGTETFDTARVGLGMTLRR